MACAKHFIQRPAEMYRFCSKTHAFSMQEREIKLRQSVEQDLEACRQQLRQEKEERKKERDEMEQDSKRAMSEVGAAVCDDCMIA